MVSMRCRVSYLQCHGATGETPISSFKKGNKWQQIRGYNITAAIRSVFQSEGPSIVFIEADISTHSLRARGGMYLLMEQVYPDTIRVVGRWQSDMILRYLHPTENSVTEGLLANMFKHGAYALIPPTHAGNYCHAALKVPQGPFIQGVMDAWYRISVVTATRN